MTSLDLRGARPGARHSARRGLALALSLLGYLGCGSDGGGDLTNPGDGGGSTLPAQLVGTWRFQNAGDVLCDPSTGQCTTSYARSESLKLTGDGHFEHALFAESNFAPCSLNVLHQSQGTAEVEDSSLTLRIAEGETKVEDSCGQDSDTDEKGQTDVYTWSLSEGDGGAAQLTLVDAENNEIGPFEQE